MKGNLRIFLLAFIVVSLALLAGASYFRYTGRRVKSVSVDKVELIKDGAVKAEGVRYSGTKDGRIEWELEAEEAVYNESDEFTALTGVKIIFFSEEGINYTLKSKSGSYDKRAGQIEASGGVTVLSTDGLKLVSASLSYSASTGEITTSDPVVIDSGALHVSGVGLMIDINTKRIVVPKNVRAEITDASN